MLHTTILRVIVPLSTRMMQGRLGADYKPDGGRYLTKTDNSDTSTRLSSSQRYACFIFRHIYTYIISSYFGT